MMSLASQACLDLSWAIRVYFKEERVLVFWGEDNSVVSSRMTEVPVPTGEGRVTHRRPKSGVGAFQGDFIKDSNSGFFVGRSG